MMTNQEVLIVGMGLMGGSLSLAIKERCKNFRVTGVVRSENSKKTAESMHLADEILLDSSLSVSFPWGNYDFIIFSTPVDSVIRYIPMLPKSGKTFITDLGSTKKTIIDAINRHFGEDHRYLSSHPMCGSEFSGPAAAKVDLYDQKLCILTKANSTSIDAYDFIRGFWEQIGCWTLDMDAKEHDETLAYLSHLPHIISTLLVDTAIENETVKKIINATDKPITGGGFRDMSRIAGSNFEMWLSIFRENQTYVYESLLKYRDQLNSILEDFSNGKPLEETRLQSLWNLAKEGKKKIQKANEAD
ncbi:prephenate dehydrogenase [Leptospira ryugenii]|nr:prephenate dehydrogenase/arogenate dehydrogenase family protein [Leptospira ryugenii]